MDCCIYAEECEPLPEPPNQVAAWIRWWFCNDKYTAMAQVIVAMIYGILIAPWSSGIFFLWIFIIVYEICYYLFTQGHPRYYSVFVRTGVIAAAVLGYIIGRTASQDEILVAGVPTSFWLW